MDELHEHVVRTYAANATRDGALRRIVDDAIRLLEDSGWTTLHVDPAADAEAGMMARQRRIIAGVPGVDAEAAEDCMRARSPVTGWTIAWQLATAGVFRMYARACFYALHGFYWDTLALQRRMLESLLDVRLLVRDYAAKKLGWVYFSDEKAWKKLRDSEKAAWRKSGDRDAFQELWLRRWHVALHSGVHAGRQHALFGSGAVTRRGDVDTVTMHFLDDARAECDAPLLSVMCTTTLRSLWTLCCPSIRSCRRKTGGAATMS